MYTCTLTYTYILYAYTTRSQCSHALNFHNVVLHSTQYAMHSIEYTLHGREYILLGTKYTLHNALMQTISIIGAYTMLQFTLQSKHFITPHGTS